VSRTTWIRVAAAGVILAGLALAVVFADRFGSDPRLGSSPLVGQPVPDVTVAVIDGGGLLALADADGTVTVVNFWAPWCVPCRAEHAALLETAARYGEDVSIVGIAYQSDDDAITAYLDELGRGYLTATDPGSRAAIRFGVRGVPETFFVGSDGIVAAKVSGPVDLPLLISTIDALLAGDDVRSVETGDVQVTP
jgi:cytochrome c biogenesis protein CcmG/thiol:disulfide interchange protein DsbE